MEENVKWATFTATIDCLIQEVAIKSEISPHDLTAACLSIAGRLAGVYCTNKEAAIYIFDKAKNEMLARWDLPVVQKMRKEAQVANGVGEK